MNEIADEQTHERPSQERKTNPYPIVFLTIMIAVVANLLFSNEYSCATLPVGILALFAAVILVSLPIHRRKALLLLTLAFGITIGVAYRVNRHWAFKESFGFDMPSEVRDFRVLSRHYEGGGGDHAMFMEFHADQTLIESLAQRAGFSNDTEEIRKWQDRGDGWDGLEECFLRGGLTFRHRAWKSITPISKPHLFYGTAEGHPDGTTLLVWDDETGRVVVINFR